MHHESKIVSAMRPDNTPADNDRVEIGPTPLAFDEWASAGLECPDLPAMRAYRWNKLTQAIVDRGLDGLLMYDPLTYAMPPTPPICSCGVRTTRVAPACYWPAVTWCYGNTVRCPICPPITRW